MELMIIIWKFKLFDLKIDQWYNFFGTPYVKKINVTQMMKHLEYYYIFWLNNFGNIIFFKAKSKTLLLQIKLEFYHIFLSN